MDHIASIKLARSLISVMWLSTLIVSVVSHTYPVASSYDADQDGYESESPLVGDLKWFRYLLSAQEPRLSESKRSADTPGDHTGHKRMQFGFSGLDTLDHILTTLDRKPKPAAGSGERPSKMDKDIYYLMKVNG